MKPMMHILTLFFIVALTVGSQPLCLGDVLYDGDFSTFADGDLAGQDGWEAQLPWQVVGGVVTNSSSFTRARHLASPFAMQPGDVVRYTSEMSFSGTPNGTEFARLGLSKNNEHTGANMPQVFAGVQWSGSNLSVGGVTDTGYDSGDVIQIEITITMGATTNSWQMNVRLSNLTDGTMFEGGTVVVDEAGTVTPETAWEWLDAGGNALFGLRTHTAGTVSH